MFRHHWNHTLCVTANKRKAVHDIGKEDLVFDPTCLQEVPDDDGMVLSLLFIFLSNICML